MKFDDIQMLQSNERYSGECFKGLWRPTQYRKNPSSNPSESLGLETQLRYKALDEYQVKTRILISDVE